VDPRRDGRADARPVRVRKRRFAARAGKDEDDWYEDRSLAFQQMMQLVLRAQREALIRMRRDGELSNEMMNRLLRELDLEESRLEICVTSHSGCA
jgi:monovalent cation/hydrogen antiporter